MTITDIWPIVVSAVFCLIWFVRLEAKVLSLHENHKEHKESMTTMWVKIDALQTTMNAVLQATARLEGKMDSKK